eukprot:gene3239-6410_t
MIFLSNIYRRNPMLANSTAGFFIFSGGDLFSQFLSTRKSITRRLDYHRAVHVGFLGVVTNGICLHFWYRGLDRLFSSSMTNYKVIAYKCIADQLIYAPFSIFTYFSFTTIYKGGSYQEIRARYEEKMKESFINTWMVDCIVWPFINIVNFGVIPLNYRPTFVGCAQLGWLSYLSFIGNDFNSKKDH